MATPDDAGPRLPAKLGPYTIRERIAVGGMSEVYLATMPQKVGDARTVVLKRMLPKVAADPALRQMFADEAQLGRRIGHRNVVDVLDFGVSDDDQPYLALEYVKGMDLWRLGRWLTRSSTRLPTDLAVFVAREMLAGLHAVHEARDDQGRRLGAIHRDVSPSNVLVSVHGDVKLGDLGIAQAAIRERYPEQGTDARAKGKLGYLAPEQVRGQAPDRRADVFSAAVVTAELLMGRPLFAGGSELAVLLAIRDSKIHPFVEFARELPEGLGAVVIQALSAQPSQRPPSADLLSKHLGAHQQRGRGELQQELAHYVQTALGEGAVSLPFPPTPTRTATDPGAPLEAWMDETTTSPRILSTPPEQTYTIETLGGATLGPWPYAKVVEALSTGVLGPMDKVSISGGPQKVLTELAHLARHIPGSTSTTEQGRQSMVRSGALVPMHSGGFVGALAHGAVDRFTGLLLCENGAVRKEVYLKQGTPAFVTSNQPTELLGEHLVSRGVISRGELDMALAVMPRFEGRLGDTLAGLGLVEPVMLFRHIGEQVREKLLDLFLWPEGTCTNYVGVTPPESSFPLDFDPWDVLDEGLTWRIARGLDDSLLRRAMSDPAVRVAGPTIAALQAELPTLTGELLKRLGRPLVPGHLWANEDDFERRTRMQRALVLLFHMNAVCWVE